MYISIYHYFSEITGPIETELGKNIRWMVLYKVYAFCFDWKFNLVAMVITVLLMAKKFNILIHLLSRLDCEIAEMFIRCPCTFILSFWC